MRVYKQGDKHPHKNLIFWSYSDRFQTKEGWLSPEAYKRKIENQREYAKKNREKIKKYNENNKERIKEVRSKRYAYNREHNPLMLLLATARNSSKRRGVEYNINIDYIKSIYEKQQGLCYYTNIKMDLTFNNKSPKQISIDRIDPSLGYIVGNIALCCLSINYCKNNFTSDVLLNFLSEIKANEIYNTNFGE